MVADPINREHHIGLAGETGPQVQVVFDAAIMVDERGTRKFSDCAQLRDLPSSRGRDASTAAALSQHVLRIEASGRFAQPRYLIDVLDRDAAAGTHHRARLSQCPR